MNLKQIILSILTFTLILAFGLGSYLFIIKQTKEKLSQLEEEAISTSTTGVIERSLPSPSVREITLADQPQVEKRSSIFLQLDPDKPSYSPGETFNLIVLVKAQGEVIDGAEFLLNYDPGLIKVGEPVTGSFFSLYPQKQVNPEQGKIRVIALQSPDENKPLNQEILVTLTLTAKEKGTTSLTFDLSKTHLAGYGGKDLLQTAESLTIKVD